MTEIMFTTVFYNIMGLMYPAVVLKLILPKVGLNENAKNQQKNSGCPKIVDLR